MSSTAGELDGRRVLIVGAGSGIGRATAELCVREGASVLRADLHPGGDEDIMVDVTDSASRNELVERIRATAGELDGMVVTAGTAKMARIADSADDAWDALLGINVVGVTAMVSAVLPVLRPGSSVVTVSSSSALRSYTGFAAYSASKAAIVQWTKVCAHEVAGHGIRVNCVCPGPVDTPMLRRDTPPDMTDSQWLGLIGGLTALGRVGRAAEIAEPIAFLLSDRASFITGAVVSVDGGETVMDGPSGDAAPH